MIIKNNSYVWLRKTLLAQRFVLAGLGVTWALFLLGIGLQFIEIFRSDDFGLGLFILLLSSISFGWTGYALFQLYENIKSTKTFLENGKTGHWQKAMLAQRQFWKHLSLMLVVGFVISIVGVSFIFMVFSLIE